MFYEAMLCTNCHRNSVEFNSLALTRLIIALCPANERRCYKDNREPLLCYYKLCTSFRSHLWVQNGVTVQKHPDWVKICFALCDLDLWPWPLARTSLLSMVITPENFMMIQWQEHCEKCVKDRRTPRDDLVHVFVHNMWALWKTQMILTRCIPHA